jgi:predicted RNase H-like HicB family nuclease
VATVKKRYAIAIEKGPRNYSAYVLDVDGCVATGPTLEETTRRLREALQAHLEWMARDGDPIPEPSTVADYAEVELPAPAGAAARP